MELPCLEHYGILEENSSDIASIDDADHHDHQSPPRRRETFLSGFLDSTDYQRNNVPTDILMEEHLNHLYHKQKS